MVARMTTENGSPLSLGPIPSDKLKNLKDIDKSPPVKGMSVT